MISYKKKKTEKKEQKNSERPRKKVASTISGIEEAH